MVRVVRRHQNKAAVAPVAMLLTATAATVLILVFQPFTFHHPALLGILCFNDVVTSLGERKILALVLMRIGATTSSTTSTTATSTRH
mmetsp:Transcript_22227/g.45700  ORF Transcript_22227/g.45700 Transcript_22227/m.45700 type:complete len:87 (-) Transcript_22227:891-1151(-)